MISDQRKKSELSGCTCTNCCLGLMLGKLLSFLRILVLLELPAEYGFCPCCSLESFELEKTTNAWTPTTQ